MGTHRPGDDQLPPRYEFDAIECPFCQSEVSAMSSAQAPGHTPRTGDISGCTSCGEPSIVQVDGEGVITLRRPSAFEHVSIAADRRLGGQVDLLHAFLVREKVIPPRPPRHERRKKKK